MKSNRYALYCVAISSLFMFLWGMRKHKSQAHTKQEARTKQLIEKRRGLSPGGRFPPGFIHTVIIITGLNKLQLYVLALKMASQLNSTRQGYAQCSIP